jgi:hypothetical protein
VVTSWRRACGWLAALAVGGCFFFPTEEEIKERFRDYVNGANQCAAAAECAVASPGCPLGCWVAVRVDRKADVEAKARDLIADYERRGQTCDYGGCIQPGELTCTQGRCALAPVGTSDAAARH